MQSWIKKVFGFGLASFLCDFSHEMTVSLIPILVKQFVGAGQAPLFLGIIASISDAFASFLRLTAGFLSDRLSRKKPIIMLGYGMSALFSALVGYAHSLWGILIYRMLAFAGSGLREPPRDALIATIVEPEHYGRAFGLQRAMDTLGSLAGPLVTAACITIVSMKTIFALSFIPGILAVFAIMFFAQDVMTPKKQSTIPPTLWQDLMVLPRRFKLFLAIVAIFDISCFNKLLLLARAHEILTKDPSAIAQWLVLLYAVFNLVRACSEILIGFLSDYINRIMLLALFGCGTFAGAAYMLLTPHATFAYCCIIFSLTGISAAAMMTLKKACAADMLPADIRGLGYGVLQAGEGIAALISSSVIGFLWTRYSATLGFSYVITLSLTAMILLIVFSFSSGTKHISSGNLH